MKHYFISENHSKDDFFEFKAEFGGERFIFTSCNDVFSKDKLDEGSLVLVETIIKSKENYSGTILDMGCGYGTISVLLSRFLDCNFDMCDINTTAVELSQINADKNKAKANQIFVSNLFENVTKNYDHIVSNPPIKTGKKLLFDFVEKSFGNLVQNGSLTVVIKKNLGADSLKKHMTNIFGNCEVLKRHKGYYILFSKK